jgi:hypothetical protein
MTGAEEQYKCDKSEGPFHEPKIENSLQIILCRRRFEVTFEAILDEFAGDQHWLFGDLDTDLIFRDQVFAHYIAYAYGYDKIAGGEIA